MKRWHKVQMTELRQIWADCKARGTFANGCTHYELKRIYGENVQHRTGKGWYKLTSNTNSQEVKK